MLKLYKVKYLNVKVLYKNRLVMVIRVESNESVKNKKGVGWWDVFLKVSKILKFKWK